MEENHWRNCAKGPQGELFVCIDLMNRGFEVFRAVGNFESFDLVAHKDGRLLRIQVKAGSDMTNLRFGRQDIVAFVNLISRTIEYDPPFQEPRMPSEGWDGQFRWESFEDAEAKLAKT